MTCNEIDWIGLNFFYNTPANEVCEGEYWSHSVRHSLLVYEQHIHHYLRVGAEAGPAYKQNLKLDNVRLEAETE